MRQSVNSKLTPLRFFPICVVFMLFVSACTTLQPVQLPDEHTPDPSDAPLWQSLAEIRSDNWFVLLNDGKSALDWRLMAIDSAVESIDLQTFLWDFDTAVKPLTDRVMGFAGCVVVAFILPPASLSFLLATRPARS